MYGCIAWNCTKLNILSPYCKEIILHIFGGNLSTDGAAMLYFPQNSGYLYLSYLWLKGIEFHQSLYEDTYHKRICCFNFDAY